MYLHNTTTSLSTMLNYDSPQAIICETPHITNPIIVRYSQHLIIFRTNVSNRIILYFVL